MKDWKIEKELRRKIWTTKTNYSDSVTRFGEFFPLWQTFEGSLRVWQIFTYILVPTFIAENAQRLKRIWPYGHTELVLYKSFTIELLVRASGDGGWALLPLYDILPYPPISISGSGFRSMGDLGWLWPDIFDGDGSEIRNIWKHLIPPSKSDFRSRFKHCLWPRYFLLQSKDTCWRPVCCCMVWPQ